MVCLCDWVCSLYFGNGCLFIAVAVEFLWFPASGTTAIVQRGREREREQSPSNSRQMGHSQLYKKCRRRHISFIYPNQTCFSLCGLLLGEYVEEGCGALAMEDVRCGPMRQREQLLCGSLSICITQIDACSHVISISQNLVDIWIPVILILDLNVWYI